MRAILDVILLVLEFYTYLIFASVIFSWLYAFNVINTGNQFVAMIGRFLHQITEPVLRPIRRFVPDFGGIDISPIILLFAIFFLQRIIDHYLYPRVF